MRFTAASLLTRVAGSAVAIFIFCSSAVEGQTISNFCAGELGEPNWACGDLEPIPAQVQNGNEDLLPIPGSPNPLNPLTYKQISGKPVTFDADTGERTSESSSGAVFAIHGVAYWCTLAESNGEAVLFDAPEGFFVSSAEEIPTGTWLTESIEAILAPGTKLKYIVYTHSHWDHIGAARFVYDHFTEDDHSPTIIASRRITQDLNTKDRRDPDTVFGAVFGNNRNVPIGREMDGSEYSELAVGGLRFQLEKIHGHERGDLFMYLDKTLAENAAQGIDNSIFMVIDVIYPGWAPFFDVAIGADIGDFYAAMDEIATFEIDVLVGGHLTRTGTIEDVYVQQDFFADILAGARNGIAVVGVADVLSGTGVLDPANPNVGNLWLFQNELLERQTTACVDYVLDAESRGRDWVSELAGVELVLRSHCWAVFTDIRIG